MNYLLLNFPIHGDHNGKLVALEKRADFPFEIRRVYYVWDTAHDAIRGKHAHRNLEQVIICVRGSCDFIVDDGVNRETIHLNNPAQGLYISEDCMVVVLASEHYNPDDYIHDYEEFKKSVAKSKK